MHIKSLIVAVLCGVLVAAVGASSALAGEITGNAKWIAGSEEAPLKGHSSCAYSGQNDEFVLGDESAARTQSWGQNVSASTPVVGGGAGIPGFACNPTRSFEE